MTIIIFISPTAKDSFFFFWEREVTLKDVKCYILLSMIVNLYITIANLYITIVKLCITWNECLEIVKFEKAMWSLVWLKASAKEKYLAVIFLESLDHVFSISSQRNLINITYKCLQTWKYLKFYLPSHYPTHFTFISISISVFMDKDISWAHYRVKYFCRI